MKRSYDEIMDHIQLTDQARQRILRNLSQAAPESSRSKVLRPRLWRQTAALAACLTLVVAGAALWRTLPAQNPPYDPGSSSQIVTAVPGMTEMADRAALEAALGFPVEEVTSLPFSVDSVTYLNGFDRYAQITYTGADQTAEFRKAPGTEDISGDLNVYPAQAQVPVQTWTVTLKGSEDRFALAAWTDGDYAYSLSLSQGVSAGEWYNILASIQA